MNDRFPIPNGQVPILGQQQIPMFQVIIPITPELKTTIDEWVLKTGIDGAALLQQIVSRGLTSLGYELLAQKSAASQSQ